MASVAHASGGPSSLRTSGLRGRVLGCTVLLMASLRLVAPAFCLMKPASPSSAPHACCGPGLRALDPACCATPHPMIGATHAPVTMPVGESIATARLEPAAQVRWHLVRPSDRTHSPPLSPVLRV
ncbi:MAG: hypothetical protein DMF78_25440 [Acidobacteria bacterium]|nr:MAG: hypothetical protein DMF78_25440 [Acidobacteriota bacterium]